MVMANAKIKQLMALPGEEKGRSHVQCGSPFVGFLPWDADIV